MKGFRFACREVSNKTTFLSVATEEPEHVQTMGMFVHPGPVGTKFNSCPLTQHFNKTPCGEHCIRKVDGPPRTLLKMNKSVAEVGSTRGSHPFPVDMATWMVMTSVA